MTKTKDATAIPDEKFICIECGTELATEEQFCPDCGAPMEHFGKEPDIKEEDDEDHDLSDDALHKGIDEKDDSAPLSLEALREEEEDEDADSYHNHNDSNTEDE